MAETFEQFDFDPDTGIETSTALIDGQFVVRHKIPRKFLNDLEDENRRRRNDHDWKKAIKNPYVPVASIPENIHYETVAKCGFDPTVGLYDRKHYNKLLTNNPDFENFRLTPGKV